MTTQAAVRTPGTVRTRARAAWRPALVVLAAIGLFILYWRQSESAALSSDGASNVLQAWAMLHGNVLLHHWRVSDLSFYTTELPQYALIEYVLGLGAGVARVGAAMTYTLLVLLAAVLARGDARGRVGWARALVAAGIMVAPQLSATQIVLLSPDHTGTAVPVLVTWLIIDRVTPDRWKAARWAVPLVVFVLLTWTMIADSIVLITCIAPLVLVCVVRACTGLAGLIRRGVRSAPRWYELSLAGAAAVAGGLGSAAPRVIAALGGYRQGPVEAETAVAALRHHAWVTFQGVLELFGANVFDARPAIEVVFVWLHLVGAIGVICALGLALARLFRVQDLVIPVFAVAIVLNLASYMFSLHAAGIVDTREIAAVLPLGAVLAGRVLAEPLLNLVQAASKSQVLAAAGARRGRRGLPGHARVRRGAVAGAARLPAAGQLAGRARSHRRAGRLLAGQQHHAGQRRPGPGQRGDGGPATANWCRTSGRPTIRVTTRRCTTLTSSWPTARPRRPGRSRQRCVPSALRGGRTATAVT